MLKHSIFKDFNRNSVGAIQGMITMILEKLTPNMMVGGFAAKTAS